MTKTPTALKKQPNPFTKARLRKHLHTFRDLLRQRRVLVDQYRSLVVTSDFFRIANFKQDQPEQKLSEDCFIVLLSELAGLVSDSSATRNDFLERCQEFATPTIKQQLKLVLDCVDDPLWQIAETIQWTAKGVPQRRHSDTCELLLILLDQRVRKSIGSYYTPSALADELTHRIERSLIEDFDEAAGFCGEGEVVQFLDPAAGTGVFLLSVLNAASQNPSFSQSTALKLIQRMNAIELHPAVAAICHCRLQKWFENQWRHWDSGQIPIYCGDALRIFATQSYPQLEKSRVILGNPPFNSLSANSNEWIKQLLNGTQDGVSYYEIDGQPIAEKKSWLHDDYIRFYRLAHHLIEKQGSGLIGFISNRSFIDNVTFRGMRWQLAESFDKIGIREYSTSEKGFDIWSDVASTLLIKTNETTDADVEIRHRKSDSNSAITPRPPNYFFRPTRAISKSYLDSISLNDAFQFQGSAAITARDWFITDLCRDRLVNRIENFCDLSISDARIREKYFDRCRSRRYPAGDTRSWRLSAARKWLRKQNWRPSIQQCCYRPFDRRWILWLPQMIDWPRMKLMECVSHPGNRCLVSRRQFPSNQPACYFWAVNDRTIDGIIRSDNRGNERIFPMLRQDEEGNLTSNLTDRFLELATNHWSGFRELGQSADLDSALFHYQYGLFFTPRYREQHHEALSTDYPRIVFSRCEEQTARIIDVGRRLCDIHLESGGSPVESKSVEEARSITPTYDEFRNRIAIGDFQFENVAPSDWQFRIGTHQVLKKWALDRKRHAWTSTTRDRYLSIIDLVQETRRLVDSLSDIEL